MSALIDRLKSDFQDPETRHVYVDEFLNYYLATQIQVLREQRKWGPHDLAETANLSCSNVEDLEDVSYSSWTLDSLKRLARAFDVVLKVHFVSFGERLKDIDQLSRESLECPPFDDDLVFSENNKTSDVKLESALNTFGQVRYSGIEHPETSKRRGRRHEAPIGEHSEIGMAVSYR